MRAAVITLAALALPVADAFAPTPMLAGGACRPCARAGAASVQMATEASGAKAKLAQKCVALFSALCVGGSAAPQGARARTVVSAPVAAELVGQAPGSHQVQRGGAVVAVGGDFHVVAAGAVPAETAPAAGLERLKGYLREAKVEELLSDKKTVAKAGAAVSAAGLLYVLTSTASSGKDDKVQKKTPAAKAQTPAAEKKEVDSAAMLLKMKKEELQAARSSGARRESTTLGVRPDPSITGTDTASRGGSAAGEQGTDGTFVDAEGKPVLNKKIGARPLGYQTTTLTK